MNTPNTPNTPNTQQPNHRKEIFIVELCRCCKVNRQEIPLSERGDSVFLCHACTVLINDGVPEEVLTQILHHALHANMPDGTVAMSFSASVNHA